jgi:hypothetical protein
VEHLEITSHLCNNKHYIHHHRLTGARSKKKNNAKKLTKKIASAYPVLILTSRYCSGKIAVPPGGGGIRNNYITEE